MAKFPVNPGDSNSAITDALNYTLSGPGGLGQNFKGFSSPVINSGPPTNVTAYLTGNYRPPFTQTAPASTFVAPIALATAEYLDPRTIKFTYATPQATPPFALGNGVATGGITPSDYDYTYSGVGVIESTTTYCIVRINGDGTTPAPGTGGTIGYNPFISFSFVSTDANAKVTVNGASDRVFISAQLNSILTYMATGTSQANISVMINRYYATTNSDPTNPDFLFQYDTTIAVKNYRVTLEPTTGSVSSLSVASGTNHVPRTTFPKVYSVQATPVTGTGNRLILNIENRPNVITTSTGLSSGGPYFAPGAAQTYRDAPWNFKTPTAVVGNGTTVRITVTNTGPAFTTLQAVTLTGAAPYDGTYDITAATATYIEFLSPTVGTATLTSPQISNPSYNLVVTVVDPGYGFANGDTVLVTGDLIGGASGVNDLTLTIDQVTTGTATLPPTTFNNWYSPVELETTFTAVIDEPPIGYYWYLVEIEVDVEVGIDADAVVSQVEFGYRTLSAQVVKA
jgi:hypothetical protein